MSFANVGKRWSTASFPGYLRTQPRPKWAKSVTLHYTASPSLAQRPHGFTAQHIENIRDFYVRKYGWNRGPHFFTDEDDIFGMTPPTIQGIHAASFNSTSIGTEALGLYDKGCEDPKSGRGLAVWKTTASCNRAILDWLGLPVNKDTVKFHRHDPKTTKTCPGTLVDLDWVIGLILEAKPGSLPDTAEPDTGSFMDAEMVPFIDYLVEKSGLPYGDLAKLLTRDKKLYLFKGIWIEGAHYDAEAATTLAPKSEAEEALALLRG